MAKLAAQTVERSQGGGDSRQRPQALPASEAVSLARRLRSACAAMEVTNLRQSFLLDANDRLRLGLLGCFGCFAKQPCPVPCIDLTVFVSNKISCSRGWDAIYGKRGMLMLMVCLFFLFFFLCLAFGAPTPCGIR